MPFDENSLLKTRMVEVIILEVGIFYDPDTWYKTSVSVPLSINGYGNICRYIKNRMNEDDETPEVHKVLLPMPAYEDLTYAQRESLRIGWEVDPL